MFRFVKNVQEGETSNSGIVDALGRCHAIARQVSAGGGSYEGAWRHGVKEGLGVHDATAWGHFAGEYAEGVKEGFGCETGVKGSYEGQWSGDVKHGIGWEVEAAGTQFVGEYDRGHRMRGVKIMEDGSREYSGAGGAEDMAVTNTGYIGALWHVKAT